MGLNQRYRGRCFRNGSLGLCGEKLLRKALFGAGLRSSPLQEGAVILVHNHLLGRPSRPPFFLVQNIATIALTNDERNRLHFESKLILSPPGMLYFYMADTERRPVTLAVATWGVLGQPVQARNSRH